MTQPRATRPSARARRTVLLVIAFGVGGAALPAEAMGATVMTRPADHSDNSSSGDIIGNGRNNRNLVTVNSPSLTHGNQTIQNANLNANAPTQAAFCKARRHHCKIHQRLVVWP